MRRRVSNSSIVPFRTHSANSSTRIPTPAEIPTLFQVEIRVVMGQESITGMIYALPWRDLQISDNIDRGALDSNPRSH
ncbi:hypothetical protein CEXT_605331 [Caerostris extrusa]|uniref:Uncharacterized protein n=1 Tax=Caerostris extrusa TaxID=172846 RepID=A0AAV4TXP3_CAEEX|nr:hypothetical protein CEXT_605331 [Caerostris extrusa]